MTSRLALICHGATMATRLSAFPADETLEERVLSATGQLSPIDWRADVILVSPMRAARQTAEELSLNGNDDPGLRDLDYGRWAGRPLAEIGRDEPENLVSWLGDADFDGHGGESIASLLNRSRQWLDQQAERRGRMVAISHAAVLKALMVNVLSAPVEAFWRIDVTPLSLAEFRHDGRRWALRSCGVPLAAKRK